MRYYYIANADPRYYDTLAAATDKAKEMARTHGKAVNIELVEVPARRPLILKLLNGATNAHNRIGTAQTAKPPRPTPTKQPSPPSTLTSAQSPEDNRTAIATITRLVSAHVRELSTFTRNQLTDWGRVHHIDTGLKFSAYKKALLAHGIDYDAMKLHDRLDATTALAEAASASVTLYTNATATTSRFAICDKNHNPIWYGTFYGKDLEYNGGQASGELAAAKKAIWLASKVKEKLHLPAIRCTLKVQAEWLTGANTVRHRENGGGQARSLGSLANRSAVLLTVEHIASADNPAEKYTTASGFLKWQDTDLSTLLD